MLLDHNMREQEHHEFSGITLPRDDQLPFFAYGSLKPNEPAHHQIKDLLQSIPTPAVIYGTLWIRDGLPLLQIGGDAEVDGYLLKFRPERSTIAYEKICRFEPREHYHWKEGVSLKKPSVRVNVLVGKKLERGRAVQLEAQSWTLRQDPVFSDGMDAVRAVINSDATLPFKSAPPKSFDWPRFFRLQMGYLLLWSAIERYTALLVGAAVKPAARIREFGENEIFHAAFKQAGVSRRVSVCDSRDPRQSFALEPSNPSAAIRYYYQVRNNLSHRGKGAWADGEIVRNSLLELTRIFECVLRWCGK
jgi:gamma-glutamylcyclotransferase (GGCT)/AIG2-like uncharacterized protein YtfP